MDRIVTLLRRQPIAVIGASITTLVLAAIGVVNSFEPGTVTPDQQDQIVKALGAMWVVLALIWPTVTPAGAPKLPEGKDVRLPDGTTGTVVKR